jgi:transposase
MMRVGLFKPVHVKTLVAQEQRMLLTSRKLLQRKLLDADSDLRGTLRNFGLKVGVVSSFPTRGAGTRSSSRTPQASCDRRAAPQRPPGHAPAVDRPAQDAARHGPRRPGVPAADDRPRGRRSSDIRPTISAVKRLSVWQEGVGWLAYALHPHLILCHR